jgi:hypothetical protein
MLFSQYYEKENKDTLLEVSLKTVTGEHAKSKSCIYFTPYIRLIARKHQQVDLEYHRALLVHQETNNKLLVTMLLSWCT